MAPYQIILADDHALFREGIKRIIDGINDLEVVGQVGDGLELLNALKDSLPEMVILDLTMPGLQGVELTQEIKKLYPPVKILILTMHKSKEHLSRVIAAGADGYLLKENAYGDLIRAIETIRQGGNYISSLMSNQMIDLFRKKRSPDAEDILTPREKEILSLIAEGKSSKEIAQRLSLSIATIRSYAVKMKKKLNVKNSAELIKYGIEHGDKLSA